MSLLAKLSRGYDHAFGLVRSLRMYYGDPAGQRRLAEFYGQFVKPGDLCFDIGAHVGNRTRCFRKLGARVVAVEPQPQLFRFLRLILGRDRDVVLRSSAIGREPGFVTLMISSRTPTVTTGSSEFLAAVTTVPSFAWVDWDQRIEVPVETLDQLIASYGRPAFVKIDVEGMEAQVLAGLSDPLPALSFEFIPAFRGEAVRCLERLEGLGRWRFNVSISEERTFRFDPWVDRGTVEAWLDTLPDTADSGDIYAIFEESV